MDLSDINQPKVTKVDSDLITEETFQIINLSYDLYRLVLTLSLPNYKKIVYVTFENVTGFRLLDEGDLLEFWGPKTRVNGWLWKVESGGWYDLEKLRNGFVSGIHGNDKEFLVLGEHECINVLTNTEPKLEIIE